MKFALLLAIPLLAQDKDDFKRSEVLRKLIIEQQKQQTEWVKKCHERGQELIPIPNMPSVWGCGKVDVPISKPIVEPSKNQKRSEESK